MGRLMLRFTKLVLLHVKGPWPGVFEGPGQIGYRRARASHGQPRRSGTLAVQLAATWKSSGKRNLLGVSHRHVEVAVSR